MTGRPVSLAHSARKPQTKANTMPAASTLIKNTTPAKSSTTRTRKRLKSETNAFTKASFSK